MLYQDIIEIIKPLDTLPLNSNTISCIIFYLGIICTVSPLDNLNQQ